MTSVSAGHIILTPTQPVGSGRPQRGSTLGPPHQESHALPTELPRCVGKEEKYKNVEREGGGGGGSRLSRVGEGEEERDN